MSDRYGVVNKRTDSIGPTMLRRGIHPLNEPPILECKAVNPAHSYFVRSNTNQLFPRSWTDLRLIRLRSGCVSFTRINISSTVANSYGYPPSQSLTSRRQSMPRFDECCLIFFHGFLKRTRFLKQKPAM